MRHVFVCLSLLAAALFAPAAASAATVSISTSAAPYGGGVSVSSFADAVNTITVSVAGPTRLRVVDTSETLTESAANCAVTSTSPSTVECDVTALAAEVIPGGGDDTVTIVGAIRSYLSGFTGNDTLQGGSAIDELEGGAGNDTLRGGSGNDLLYDSYTGGSSGDDDVDGEGDSDLVYGGGDADTLSDSGASGTDSVTYAFAPSAVTLQVADGLSNDGTVGGTEGDQILTGFERIQGSPAGDTIVGGPAAETINGSGGNDDLDGGPGADTIEGNGGDDTIRSRDGQLDAHLACDSPSDPSGTVGAADVAIIDAADPEPIGCETVDRLPGAATPTPAPGATPVPGATPAPSDPIGGGAPPIVDTSLAPLCPASAALDVRTSSAFGPNSRVQATVPVADWFVLASVVYAADNTRSVALPNVRRSTGPGLVEVPISLSTKLAAGTVLRISVTVVARGCRFITVSDDVVYQPTGASKAAVVPAPAARLQQPAQLEIINCDWPSLSEQQRREADAKLSQGLAACYPEKVPEEEPKCEHLVDLVFAVKMRGECIKKDLKTGIFESKLKVKVNGIELVPSGGSVTFNPKTKQLQVTGKHQIQLPLFIDKRPQGAVVFRDTTSTTTITLANLKILLSTPGGGKVGGFLLDTAASAELNLISGGGSVHLTLKLPKKFGGLQARTLVKWNESGIELSDAVIELPKVQVGRLTLSEGELRYKRRDGLDTWFGKLTVGLPAPKASAPPELEMMAEFVDGSLTKGRIEVRDINKPFGHPAIFLQRVAVDLAVNAITATLGGEVGVTAGPKILKKSVASFDGRLDYTFGADPGIWSGTGALELLSGQKADGSFKYSTDGKLDFEGRVQLPYVLVNIDGRVKGSVALPSSFKLAGQVELEIVGLPTIQGDLAANENAVTVCGTVKGLSLGLTIPYATNSPELLQGCGLAPWGKGKASKSAVRLATTAASTNLPGGLPKAAFAAVGAGGVPNVILVGPGGRTLQPGVDSPDGIAFANAGDSTVYFLVNKPAAGEWRLEVQDGSVPVKETRVAEGLVEPDVKASVAADGEKRILKYDIDGPKGQRVTFVESAIGVEKTIRTVSGTGKGSITFSPTDGDPGKRDVIAYVEQDGVPAGGGEKVASFRVGPTPKPSVVGCYSSFVRESKITTGGESSGGGCTRLKVTRGNSGEKLTASWGKATGAESYLLEITSAGRREARILGPAARNYALKDVDRDAAVSVEIAALNEDGVAGPTVRASLAALKLKPTTKQPLADDGVLALAEFTG